MRVVSERFVVWFSLTDLGCRSLAWDSAEKAAKERIVVR